MLDDGICLISDEKPYRMRILLAEDDASMRRFLEITLQRADYRIVSAEDGLAAMKIALAENFDAVIADAVMPNLSGYDLCRMLRQNPNYENVPLIILSGLEQNAASDQEESCADAFLLKNVNLKEELPKHLADILARKKAQTKN